MDGTASWDYIGSLPDFGERHPVEFLVLKPSGWLMHRSKAIHRFYSWEYTLAKGRDGTYLHPGPP
ncbi:MAG TPA: hypothetical protein VG733_11735 [Chthoniobacteraceae bacterium]|nr:hypothetical protein [Chthoniobacteraceae bacterium]